VKIPKELLMRFHGASMCKTLGLCLLLAWAGGPALAQVAVAKPFIGKWSVEWQTDQHKYEAVMVVTETGGSWQTYVRRRSNPCAGREVQMQHDKVTPETLEMTLKFEDAIPGCRNARVRLQVDDKGTVTGKRSEHELQMKRE
jgi:hypothetical protein